MSTDLLSFEHPSVLLFCLYKRSKCLKIFNGFLCINLDEGKGDALMHVYVWEHKVSLYYRIALLMFTNLGRDEVLMVPHMY